MECFVANAPADPSLLVVDLREVPAEASTVIVRCHLSVDAVLDATEDLFARFIEDALERDASASEEPRILDPAKLGKKPTQLGSQLSYGLKILREHLPREFLEALLGKTRGTPRFALRRLDELRGTGDRIVFSATALELNP